MKKTFLISVILLLGVLTINAQNITYNFNDGTWGTPATERPESGSFDNKTINNVKFENASLYKKDGKGNIRIILDKRSAKSSIEFPEFANGKEVLIDASVGTEEKSMLVEEKVGKKWQTIQEQTLTKQKATYTFKLSEGATQIRISNPTTSALYIFTVAIKQ